MSAIARKLRVERLEDRRMLAVDITFRDGTVSITGDGNEDTVIVQQTDNNEYTIFGQINLGDNLGDPGNAIDNVAFVRNVKKFKIDLKNGDDQFGFQGNHEGGRLETLEINMGGTAGSNSDEDFVIVDNLVLQKDVSVDTGRHDDIVQLSANEVRGSTKVNTGAGADIVALGAGEVFSGFQLNAVQDFELQEFGKNVEVDLGGGEDNLEATGNCFGDESDFKVKAGAHDDVVVLKINYFGDEVNIDMGGGDDTLAADCNVFTDEAVFNGGAHSRNGGDFFFLGDNEPNEFNRDDEFVVKNFELFTGVSNGTYGEDDEEDIDENFFSEFELDGDDCDEFFANLDEDCRALIRDFLSRIGDIVVPELP